MTASRILITAPMKIGDATQWTYQWARKAYQMTTGLGYKVKILEKEQCSRGNVEKEIKSFKPRVFLHLGHGCDYSLQNNTQCIINKRHSVNEIMSLAYSECECDRKRALEILTPDYNKMDGDPCELSCLYESNIDILEDSLVVAIACNSAAGLGPESINSGVQAYAGEKDMLMFPVDGLRTQEVFGDIELSFVRELLLDRSFQEAEKMKLKIYDDYITKNKHIKYISLLALFNRLNFEILGDKKATIYQ